VHGVVFGPDFIEQAIDFKNQCSLHYEYRNLPLVLHGPISPPPSLKNILWLKDNESLPSILPTLLEYEKYACIARYDLGRLQYAEFHYQTIEQAHSLAKHLSAQYPQPTQILVGLIELLINAIEHGNLGISFNDKSILLKEGRWSEEVQKRLANPFYQSKKVTVHFQRLPDKIKLSVHDEGEGFKWHDFEKIDPRRMLDAHGRGIMIARSFSFSSVAYNEPGNCVYTEYLTNTDSNL
jgi:anti-sigma regulatory factor (Ser/Thr protein kinase)